MHKSCANCRHWIADKQQRARSRWQRCQVPMPIEVVSAPEPGGEPDLTGGDLVPTHRDFECRAWRPV